MAVWAWVARLADRERSTVASSTSICISRSVAGRWGAMSSSIVASAGKLLPSGTARATASAARAAALGIRTEFHSST